MITAHRIGLALALAAGLTLGGCAKLQRDFAHGWMATFTPAPELQKYATHRHKTRVFRYAPRPAREVIDPDLVTGSVTPVAAPQSVLAACKQRLYLETATSTEELHAAETACKDVIVNAPIGAASD